MKRPGRAQPPTFRRQFNQSFQTPDGNFSITKAISVAGQVMVLYWTGRLMETLIDKADALFIMLSVLIAPDILKKVITMWFARKR